MLIFQLFLFPKNLFSSSLSHLLQILERSNVLSQIYEFILFQQITHLHIELTKKLRN